MPLLGANDMDSTVPDRDAVPAEHFDPIGCKFSILIEMGEKNFFW